MIQVIDMLPFLLNCMLNVLMNRRSLQSLLDEIMILADNAEVLIVKSVGGGEGMNVFPLKKAGVEVNLEELPNLPGSL